MLQRTRRKLAEAGLHSLSYFAVRRHISTTHPKVLVLGVYRHKNALFLARIADEAKSCQWEIKLWALDRIHPLLGAYSVGSGSGLKFPLLNELIRGKDLSEFDWIVVTDDDFLFEHGSLAAFLALADKAGMAIAQPAQTFSSFSTHPITVCNPSAIARLTTFVEIGPLFAVSRAWYRRVFPFPEENGMGWGLDIEWSDLQAHGARLGIVDWVALRHLYPGTIGYDKTWENRRLAESLRARGFASLADSQKTLAIWRPWQACAPWLAQSSE